MHSKKSDGKNLPDYFSFGWMMLISLCITLCLNWPTMNSRFWHTLTQDWYHIACANTFATVFIMITFTNMFTSYLDSKWLWEKDLWKRLVFQILLGFMAPILICYFFSWVSFYFLNVNISSTRYIRNMSSLLVLICIMINLLHMVYYYIYRSSEWLNSTAGKPKPAPVLYLFIPDGKGEKKISTAAIAYIYVENGTTYIQHHNSDLDVCFIALDSLYKKLDEASFFKATRSYIVSSAAVEGYVKIPHKGLKVRLQPETPEPINVSRSKAPLFIDWLKTDS
ncbi:LytR/AlgR family response regulator transcription factor [Pedobacter nototheniae]|uniref:LytR/AlgR family response regulator transcription factor n=1 Tax=Pedobacter nototheniae TaxID=2488994 RepID=UPI0013F45A5B|nr:LytTR family DNA-binding domain-containing protein [Pedobacter nototheniae]